MKREFIKANTNVVNYPEIKHNKHFDWTRFLITIAILSYLIGGSLVTYHFYAQNWTQTVYVENGFKGEPGTWYSQNYFYDEKQIPQYWYWEYLGSLGITISTPIALTISGFLLYGVWVIISGIAIGIYDFYYHNGEKSK